MSRVAARGKYLFEGDAKFFARGVSYGPFAPNSRGEQYPEPERAAADFALMRELGANTLRLYVTPPPWLIEEAAKAGLKLLVGFGWPVHMAFLDSPDLTREIRETIRKGVEELKPHRDTILGYTIGNEVRSDIVRWHGPDAISKFLSQLCDIGRQVDPEGLFTYANYPSVEYLDLSFLDFVSFNVYLHHQDDYRRYLTHLLASTGDRPLVLSETGMDTIREGEDHQAELLSCQSRAAFELGLSGFVVFAFTDEWYTGGAEISDWAFGLTTRDRRPKKAFGTVGDVYRSQLPPLLPATPRVSIIVAAYDAVETIGGCLDSLRELNYPDFETIVVDDGSSDATGAIAEQKGTHVVRVDHRGLGAARNAGVDAATGQIVAFIDADARADRDWLYHLVETIERRDVAAAGGLNFPPPPSNVDSAAMAAAPGLPREVRSGDDQLSQLCGCSMAIRKSALLGSGGFDPAFTSAGDDVDLSWRLAERGELLAIAPGAVVLHQPRATIGAYLRQQLGYGAGEGLLWRRWPLRTGASDGMYAPGSWLQSLLGGARVYYGAFGRGLFQSAYASSLSPLVELPLTVYWVAISFVLFDLRWISQVLGALGTAGLAITVAVAAASAIRAPLAPRLGGAVTRIRLFILYLLGPVARSLWRERVKWQLDERFLPSANGEAESSTLTWSGTTVFAPPAGDGEQPVEQAKLLSAARRALIRRGVAVVPTDGFQSYDLQLIVAPALRIPINALRRDNGRIALRWRLGFAAARSLLVGGIAVVLLWAAGLDLRDAIGAAVIGGLAVGAFAWTRARKIPILVREAALDAAFEIGATTEDLPETR